MKKETKEVKNIFDGIFNFDNLTKDDVEFINSMFEREKEKKKRDWYGIPGIKFIWINEWADPLIEYNGRTCSCFIVEDTMWEMYREDGGDEADLDAFDNYMRDNAEYVYELADLALFPEHWESEPA